MVEISYLPLELELVPEKHIFALIWCIQSSRSATGTSGISTTDSQGPSLKK
jgi:hypothetical protein